MEQTPQFKLTLSEIRPGISDIAQAVLHLSESAERLALEDRTLVAHANGRIENVAEHTSMLGIIAPAIAEQFFPELDPNKVARNATLHDILEAYVGDTATHDISEQGLQDKNALEKLGLQRLRTDFAHLPGFVEAVNVYEAQQVPEARFVRVLDKCTPALLHIANGGEVLRSYITPEGVLENSAERASALRHDYPEFERLIALREELSQLMVTELFTEQSPTSRPPEEELSAQLQEAARLVVVGGMYRHYKGKSYKVLELVIMEDTNEICVVYEAQYGERLKFSRRLSVWMEEVEYNGLPITRFTSIP